MLMNSGLGGLSFGGQPIADIEMDPELEKELEYGKEIETDAASGPTHKFGAQKLHGNHLHLKHKLAAKSEEPSNIAINTISPMS